MPCEDRAASIAPSQKLRDCHRVADAVWIAACHLDERAGVGKWQRTHEEGVVDGKDRGVGANREGERDERHRR